MGKNIKGLIGRRFIAVLLCFVFITTVTLGVNTRVFAAVDDTFLDGLLRYQILVMPVSDEYGNEITPGEVALIGGTLSGDAVIPREVAVAPVWGWLNPNVGTYTVVAVDGAGNGSSYTGGCTSLTIPASIAQMASGVFWGNTRLAAITFEGTAAPVGYADAFLGCTGIARVFRPIGTASEYDDLINGVLPKVQPTGLTLSTDRVSGVEYDGKIVLTARLSGAEIPDGQTITFAVNGNSYTAATTAGVDEAGNPIGIAAYTVPAPVILLDGNSFKAEFAGSDTDWGAASNVIDGFSVTPTDVHISLTVKDKNYNGYTDAEYKIGGEPELQGLFTGDIVSIDDPQPQIQFRNVGFGDVDRKVAIEFHDPSEFALTGTNSDKYKLVQPTASAWIRQTYVATEGTHYSMSAPLGNPADNGLIWHTSPIVITPISPYRIVSANADGVPTPGTGSIEPIKISEDSAAGQMEFYIYNPNDGGMISATIPFSYRLDTTAPTIDAIRIQGLDDGMDLLSGLNLLRFGNFYNKGIKVTVTASDATSGVETITFAGKAQPAVRIAPDDSVYTAEFTIPADGAFLVRIQTATIAVTDFAGNTTEKPMSEVSPDDGIDSDEILLETDAPEVSILLSDEEGYYRAPGGNLWYRTDSEFTVSVSDHDSGIRSIAVAINGVTLEHSEFNGSALAKTEEKSYTVNTADGGPRASDGHYTVSVTATDNAGNAADPAVSRTVYKDSDAPEIVGFEFAPIGVGETVANQTEYGYYFNTPTEVTITARDRAPSSGVKEITYHLVDAAGVSGEEITLPAPSGSIMFPLPENFKGRIVAKATDNVGNEGGDKSPESGVIVETPTTHGDAGAIGIAPQSKTARTDAEGLPLYASDVTVALSAADGFSGLRKVEWSVTAPYNTELNQSGEINLDNAGNGAGDWSVAETDANLVTKLTKMIRVSHDSNQIRVWVKLTDRAGNVSEQNLYFSIDKTQPRIEVRFDNNDADSGTYFKNNRTASIVITERNFDPANVDLRVTNTGAGTPAASAWTTVAAEDPNGNTHTAVVYFTEDGDYTFAIGFADFAGNANLPVDFAGSAAPTGFTIDKTAPVVNVAYDNNSAANSNYYSAERMATITVIEHNFDAGRVQVVGTAENSGAAVPFPATGGWTSVGDAHTAAISYTADAFYTFDITAADKAGNSAAPYTPDRFYIDRTLPEVVISGVADQSANNNTVIPVVTFSDINYDPEAVTIRLEGANHGSVTPAGAYEDSENGQVFTFQDFGRVKASDDLYTLTAAIADKAGNRKEAVIHFSVNRFGSVYVFDDSLQGIINGYTNQERDVIFREINVDSLQSETIDIKLSQNGATKSLDSRNDYQVQQQLAAGGAWNIYEYTVPKRHFETDAAYQVSVYSVDKAGNINESAAAEKAAEINFVVDKTAPVVVVSNLKSGESYAESERLVEASIKDNLKLAEVAITVNGKAVSYENEGEAYTYIITESGAPQETQIVATDAAGNETVYSVEDFLVTPNALAQIINKTPLAAAAGSGSRTILFVVGAIVLIALLVLLLRRFVAGGARRKKQAGETE
ncbi:MAG: Ig-like domain repeat protein [Clostridiales Family XIII bacterium]|jgi:hypothetical protein|nr:Ig-like domain repeat protein [Clostridiales Family XIII bacterium]